jgi:hypothetical protein
LFCSKCHTKILQGKIPKFLALNSMNVMCDNYPAALKDLTFVEECVIARRLPIGRILKFSKAWKSVKSIQLPCFTWAYAYDNSTPKSWPVGPFNTSQSPTFKFLKSDQSLLSWIGKCQPSFIRRPTPIPLDSKKLGSGSTALVDHS